MGRPKKYIDKEIWKIAEKSHDAEIQKERI